MKRYFGILFLTILIAAFASACTRAYNLSDARRYFGAPPGLVSVLKKSYEQRRDFFKELRTATFAPHLAPYPSLEQELIFMRRSLTKVEELEARMSRLGKEFDLFGQGKEQIAKTDAGWSRFNELKDRQSRNRDKIKKESQRLQKSGRRFDKLLRENKIAQAEVRPFRRQAADYSIAVERRLNSVRRQLIEAKAQIQLRSDPLWKRQASEILLQLEILAGRMESRQEDFDKARIAFEKETRDKDLIWQGPGIHTGDFLGTMQLTHRAIKDLAMRFNRDVLQLQKLGRP